MTEFHWVGPRLMANVFARAPAACIRCMSISHVTHWPYLVRALVVNHCLVSFACDVVVNRHRSPHTPCVAHHSFRFSFSQHLVFGAIIIFAIAHRMSRERVSNYPAERNIAMKNPCNVYHWPLNKFTREANERIWGESLCFILIRKNNFLSRWSRHNSQSDAVAISFALSFSRSHLLIFDVVVVIVDVVFFPSALASC